MSVFFNLKHCWARFSRPATIGMHDGRPVWERIWSKFYIEIFDTDGNRIGTKQHHFDFGEYANTYSGQPELEFSRTLNFEKYRLSWLARLRSPKLPLGPQADILNEHNEDLGQTTYIMK